MAANRGHDSLIAASYGLSSTAAALVLGGVVASLLGGDSTIRRTVLFLAAMAAVAVLACLSTGRVLARILPAVPPPDSPRRHLHAVPHPR